MLKVFISQPQPPNDNPYNILVKKYNTQLTFFSLITLETINAREFRKQKVNLAESSAVIFTSRNAIDHYFRMMNEMRIPISEDKRYFCITEHVALYLQKFTVYRKRKIFYGEDGTNESMIEDLEKHKEGLTFTYVCSENQEDPEIITWLKKRKCPYSLAYLYRTVSIDAKSVLLNKKYDIICLFTPMGVKSLLHNLPNFKKEKALLAAFGNNTAKALIELGLEVDIKAPAPGIPNMAIALDKYLQSNYQPLVVK